MTLSEMLLPEFDQEIATTRRVLERVPDGKMDWKPHSKSMALGRLTGHVAEIPRWAHGTLSAEELDVEPMFKAGQTGLVVKTRDEALAAFDADVAKAREALRATADPAFARPWTLRVGSRIVFSRPRGEVWRGFVMSHMIHHRAQLQMYLRLLDLPVPSIYGPTGDDPRPQ